MQTKSFGEWRSERHWSQRAGRACFIDCAIGIEISIEKTSTLKIFRCVIELGYCLFIDTENVIENILMWSAFWSKILIIEKQRSSFIVEKRTMYKSVFRYCRVCLENNNSPAQLECHKVFERALSFIINLLVFYIEVLRS